MLLAVLLTNKKFCEFQQKSSENASQRGAQKMSPTKAFIGHLQTYSYLSIVQLTSLCDHCGHFSPHMELLKVFLSQVPEEKLLQRVLLDR